MECCFLFYIHSILIYTDVKCHVELEQPKLLGKEQKTEPPCPACAIGAEDGAPLP
jgi:hypothetical protein